MSRNRKKAKREGLMSEVKKQISAIGLLKMELLSLSKMLRWLMWELERRQINEKNKRKCRKDET